jgi:hypothetical protein
MSLSSRLLLSFTEATMKSSSGKTFEIPSGKWKHVKKSAEWERDNKNDAKGKAGDFSKNDPYLQWTSDDGKSSMSIDAKEIKDSGSDLYLKSKGGLEFWFQRVKA